MVLLGAAAASGLLTSMVGYLPGAANEIGMLWGAGVLYGSFVLVPSARSRTQGALLLASSLVIYRAAVWVAITLVEDGWGLGSFTLAGLAGAAALGAVVYALRQSRPTFSQLTQLAGVGAAGGTLFGLGIAVGEEASLADHAAVILGYVVWQVGFTLAARLNAPAA
jgi:hypothetical protein